MVVLQSEIVAHAVLQSLFNAAAQQLGRMNPLKAENTAQTVEFNLLLELAGFRLSGQLERQVRFRGRGVLHGNSCYIFHYFPIVA